MALDVERLFEEKVNMSLYKYVSPNSAELILENGTFRWTAPRCFNDPYDIQLEVLRTFCPEEETKRFMRSIKTMIANPYFHEEDTSPVIAEMVKAIKNEQESGKAGHYETLEAMVTQRYTELFRSCSETNRQYEDYAKKIGVLCTSSDKDSLLMWSHYAANHTGAVIKIRTFYNGAPNEFSLTRQVRYRNTMPTVHFDIFSKFTPDPDNNDVLEDFLYTKGLEWRYEKEWRSVQHIDGTDFEDIQFNPLIIEAVYLGCRIPLHSRQKIIAVLDKKYPHVEVFEARKSKNEFKLDFYNTSNNH